MLKHGTMLMLLVVFLASFSQVSSNNQSHESVRTFLEEQGYTVVEHSKSLEPFKLTKKELAETFHMKVWQVQTVDVEDFIGKEITGEIFIVKNHPLDHFKSGPNKGLGKTQVYLMIVDGKVIGGTSSPITEEQLYGGFLSLEGKSFQELYPNENWREWANRWMEKYKSNK